MTFVTVWFLRGFACCTPSFPPVCAADQAAQLAPSPTDGRRAPGSVIDFTALSSPVSWAERSTEGRKRPAPRIVLPVKSMERSCLGVDLKTAELL